MVGTEIYTSGVMSHMSEETVLELQEKLVDKSSLKVECVISSFVKKSAAKKARIKVGDVIKSYAGKEVKFSPDLIKMIANNKQKTVHLRY